MKETHGVIITFNDCSNNEYSMLFTLLDGSQSIIFQIKIYKCV